MVRSSRPGQGRGRRLTRQTIAAPAYVTREIPYYALLDDEALERIERHADWLLQEIGIEFRDDPKVLEDWRSAGATVEGVRVRMPDGMARRLCKSAPAEITQLARNSNRTVQIGGAHCVFAPVYGSPFVRDLDKGRRYGSLDDFENLVKLTYMTPWLHHSGGTICEPCDIPVNKRHLDMVYAHLRYSDKPFLGSITSEERARDSIDMARIVFGERAMSEHCVIMGNVNANSPLVYDKVATQAIRAYCGQGQGIIIVPFILGGAMGPVTTAGAIAQALAEAMAGIAYSQIVKPGAPAILGNFLSSMSLRSGAPTFGMPEPALSNFAIGQLARRLNLPLRCGGSLTASKTCDSQAASESADSLLTTLMGGANYVLHAAGWLESGLVTGYEKLILDADRLGAMQVLLRGFKTDDNALAASAYDLASPGGHFLGSSHTMENYQTAYYEAQLSDSESFEQWVERGSKDAAMRAHDRWNAMLKEYQTPPLDVAIDEELKAFMDKKKRSVPDAWH